MLVHAALDPVDRVLALVGEIDDMVPWALLRPWAARRLLCVDAQNHLTLPQHDIDADKRTHDGFTSTSQDNALPRMQNTGNLTSLHKTSSRHWGCIPVFAHREGFLRALAEQAAEVDLRGRLGSQRAAERLHRDPAGQPAAFPPSGRAVLQCRGSHPNISPS